MVMLLFQQKCSQTFSRKLKICFYAATIICSLFLFRRLSLNQFSLKSYRPAKLNFPTKIQTNKQQKSVNIKNEFILPSKDYLDPNSAYYGNLYKDIYGQSIRNASIYTNERSNLTWKQYFPLIMTSLEKYKLENPSQNPEKFTRTTSTISVETNTTRFETGDTLVVHIQAKDRLNRNKTFGGDYFRARLIRKTADGKLTDGIACSIKDHLNGSYTLQVPLLMAGTFTLEVKLVLPVEGIAWFINFTSMRNNKGISYEATLNTKETVECNLDLNTYEGRENKLMCDYGNPRNGEPWFCDLPPSGNCSPITWMISRDISRAKFPKQFGEVAQIAGSGMQIKVLNGTYNRRESASNIPLVYLHKEKWVKALRSKIVSFKEDFRKCLENKPFYMFGDSTIRQFFQEFARVFDLKVYGPDNSVIWQNPKIGRSENSSSNIIVYYRGHGPPFRNPGPPSSRPYITDSIHAINVQNVTQNYVLLHLGLHPILHEPSFYLRRLLSIKKEMIRHHRSVPNTIFVVKGMNVVEWGEEWLIWRYERLLREMFKNMSNVFYLDLWDLTIVTPIQSYHPTQPVLEQQVLLLLDLVCSK